MKGRARGGDGSERVPKPAATPTGSAAPGVPSHGRVRKDRQRPSEHPEAIGAVLDGMWRGRAWGSGLRLGQLGRRWAEVVGERLAAESTPLSLENGVLVVQVSSGAWAGQVRFLAAELRAHANQVLKTDEVREVRVVADPGPAGRSSG